MSATGKRKRDSAPLDGVEQESVAPAEKSTTKSRPKAAIPALTSEKLQDALQSQSADALRAALSDFRTQTRLKPKETTGGGGQVASPGDARIKLVSSYLQKRGKLGADQILNVWNLAEAVSPND